MGRAGLGRPGAGGHKQTILSNPPASKLSTSAPVSQAPAKGEACCLLLSITAPRCRLKYRGSPSGSTTKGAHLPLRGHPVPGQRAAAKHTLSQRHAAKFPRGLLQRENSTLSYVVWETWGHHALNHWAMSTRLARACSSSRTTRGMRLSHQIGHLCLEAQNTALHTKTHNAQWACVQSTW